MANAYEDLMNSISKNWYKDNQGNVYKINGICEQTDEDVWKLQIFRRLPSGKLRATNASLRLLGELQRLEGSELEQLTQSEKPKKRGWRGVFDKVRYSSGPGDNIYVYG